MGWGKITGLRVVAFSGCFVAASGHVHHIAQHSPSPLGTAFALFFAIGYAFFGVAILLRGTE